MTNKKFSKRALLMSVVAMVLCLAMMLGTTYAWFSDSVTSGNNIIEAGNLDIELEYRNADGDWESVNADTNIFSSTLWEPGHTEVIYFRITNKGSLDLKYRFGINVASETTGVNQNGDSITLSNYIKFGVVYGMSGEGTGAYATRGDAIAAVEPGTILADGYTTYGVMNEKGETNSFALVVYMPTSVTNEANYKTGTIAPEIQLGINLVATQIMSENDSFGNNYDEIWLGEVDTNWYVEGQNAYEIHTAAELAGLAVLVNNGTSDFAGVTFTLSNDIDLNDIAWTTIGDGRVLGQDSKGKDVLAQFRGTFDGNGNTISNLYCEKTAYAGLFGRTYGATVKNLTIENALLIAGRNSSDDAYAGAAVAFSTSDGIAPAITNVTVENATVVGKNAGAIVGSFLTDGVISSSSTVNCTIGGINVGGIAGTINGESIGDHSSIVSCTVKNNYELTVSDKIGAYAGRVLGHATVDVDNTYSYVDNGVKDADGNILVANAAQLRLIAALTNYTYSNFKGVTLKQTADIDLANEEWAPIGNSSNKFMGNYDGQSYTVSNLKISGNKSNVGLFGYTTEGKIANVTVHNATVSGYLNLGVVAGTPYTTEYENILVTGDVKVDGFAYVGGVFGKSLYDNATNITVDVNEGSYVKADSTVVSNGELIAYRTYVGGVVGFMGEGGHTVSNVTSNIDVIGSTCDVGGITGIAHYGNKFKNVVCTGDVTITNAEEASDAQEIGGIAGVWHNASGHTVTIEDVSFTGKLTTNVATTYYYDGLVGAPYGTGLGTLILNGKSNVTATVATVDELTNAISDAVANGGASVVIDAGNATLGSLTSYTFPAGIEVVVENATFEGGVAVRKCTAKGNVVFNSCTFTASSTYAFHIGGGSGTVEFNDCTFYGWVSYAQALTSVDFNNCELYGNGTYATLRAHCATTMTNCVIDSTNANTSDEWNEGILPQNGASVTLVDCDLTNTTYDYGFGSVTVIVDGVTAETLTLTEE